MSSQTKNVKKIMKRKQLTAMHIRGRDFSVSDLQVIQNCVTEFYDKGRTHISKKVCEELNWRQPNGWLKDRACRDVLRKLDDAQIVNLPPPLNKRKKKKHSANSSSSKKGFLSNYDFLVSTTEFPKQITLEFAKGNRAEKEWNELVNSFHYLGYSVLVGRNIKYLIKSEDMLLGAIGFSSPAWHIDARDKLLFELGIQQPRTFTINNSRFLILPNVQINNLASHILALSTKKVAADWATYYSIKPLVVETFVQPSKFRGTCYKAANWIDIGMTQGYAKKGSSYRNSQEPKKIFLYGLDRETRKALNKLTQEV